MGWSGVSNGQLLQMAEREFDVFITGDRNLTFQQNLTKFALAIIVLKAQSTRLTDTAPLMPAVLAILTTIQPKQVVRIGPRI
jgi:hypothetical protein